MVMFVLGALVATMAYALFPQVFSGRDGIILIDDTDEKKTQWKLNVFTPIDAIPKKKVIHLQVHVQK